jgi:hypothetical protein
MKYLSIDFETTGIDPKVNQPLSFCGILDFIGNTVPVEKLPRFHCYFLWDVWTIHYMANEINYELIRRLVQRDFVGKNYIKPEEFKPKLRAFLHDNDAYTKSKITIAAKNPAFDDGFAKALGFMDAQYRYIDPAILYLRSEDEVVPGLATCLTRAGLDANGIHSEDFDAEAIIKLMRKFNHV